MFQWHVQSSKRTDVDSVSKKRRGQINYSQPLFSGCIHYDLQLHCDTPVKNKMCGLSASFSQCKSCFQWACTVVMLEDLFIEGGWYIQEKQKKGGGDWRELVWGYGDGQLSSNPQGTACYAKQNQSFSKKLGLICQPQQTLTVSHPLAPSTPSYRCLPLHRQKDGDNTWKPAFVCKW